MKYKVGDTVTIKSRQWYEENVNTNGYVENKICSFVGSMQHWLGTTTRIKKIIDNEVYLLENNTWNWVDDFLEDTPKDVIAEEGTY